jgi:hypothetical protein
MPFQLRITISGLCLFVPKTGGPLYALLPKTAGGHKHEARLFYDLSHLAAGSPGPAYELAEHAILGHVLKFNPPSTETDDLTLPTPPVISLTKDLSGAKVDPSLLTGGVSNDMARLELLRGAHSGFGTLAAFDVSGDDKKCKTTPKEKPGTRAVVWTIMVAADNLDLKQVWPTKPAGVPDTLHPRDQVLDLLVAHAVPSELPPKPTHPKEPKECDHALHFHHFYALTDRPNPPYHVPRWRRAITEKSALREFGVTCGRGIEPVTCLIAQAEMA